MDVNKKIIYYAILCIPVAQSSSKLKIQPIDVDDFLTKVMISDRFDDIADKIAEKAVEKIKHMKDFDLNYLTSTIADIKSFRVSDTEGENKTEAVVTPSQPKVEAPITIEDIAPKIPIKIDGASLIIKKDAPKVGELTLQYKKFTKKSYGSTVLDKNFSKDEEDDISKNNIAFEEKTKSIELKSGRSKESLDDKTVVSKHSDKKETERSIEVNKEDYSDSGVVLKPLLRSSASNNSASSNEDTGSDESQEHGNKVESVGLSIHRPADEYSYDDDKVTNLSSSMITRTTTTQATRKKGKRKRRLDRKAAGLDAGADLIRKEGERIYTYEKSPDYAEYHEKMSRILVN